MNYLKATEIRQFRCECGQLLDEVGSDVLSDLVVTCQSSTCRHYGVEYVIPCAAVIACQRSGDGRDNR